MHVRISPKGRKVINNKELASKLVLAVADLKKGGTVKVNGSIEIKSVTTIN